MGELKIDWKLYETHLKQSNQGLYKDTHFSDVTLVSDDLVPIRAHKFVLSSSSDVFKSLLMMNTNNLHPLLFLKGVKHKELKHILELIYIGSTKLKEDMSEDFMKAANDLKIKAFHPDKIKGEPSEMTTKEPKQSKKIKRLPQSDNNPAIKQEQHEGEDVDTEMLMREENGNGERMEEGGKLINATAENDNKNANKQCSNRFTKNPTTEKKSISKATMNNSNSVAEKISEIVQEGNFETVDGFKDEEKKCGKCNKMFPSRFSLIRHNHKFHQKMKIKKTIETPNTIENNSVNINLKENQKVGNFMSAIQDLSVNSLEGKNEEIPNSLTPKHSNASNQEPEENEVINSQAYNCTSCEAKFQKKKKLLIHISRHHDTAKSLYTPYTSFPCSGCDFEANEEHHLAAHKHLCHNKKGKKEVAIKTECLENPETDINAAEELNDSYLNNLLSGGEELDMDIQEITEETTNLKSKNDVTSIDCPKCHKSLRTKANVWRHFQTVHMGIKYPCNLCDKTFSEKDKLMKHIREKHSNSM